MWLFGIKYRIIKPGTPFQWSEFYHNLALSGLQNCAFFQSEIGTFNQDGAINTIVNIIKMNNYNQYKNRCQTWLH